MPVQLTAFNGCVAFLRRAMGAVLLWWTAQATLADVAVSFRNEVMPILSKAGCNQGTCHGNQNGKAGFKLSLRGEDPEGDFRVLTRDDFHRRVNTLDPAQSLILLKATTQIPHEGGLRVRADSEDFAALRDWIASGLPNDLATAPTLTRLIVTPTEQILLAPTNEVSLRVRAEFDRGPAREVTHRAVYEPATGLATVSPGGIVKASRSGEETILVRFLDQQVAVRLTFVPAREGFVWQPVRPHNFIDEAVFTKLRTLRMNPSALCSDVEFVRRAYLDLLGLLPTAEEARTFVADLRADKRARLVDRLLERSEFADFWALKWADVLRVEEKVLDAKGVKAFHAWIRRSLVENQPMDEFVREVVGALGSTYKNPPANFYRALREPVARAEATAQLFLGTRLQCAKCHNHPFDRWTQADYYDWAGVFAPISYKVVENRRRDGLDSHEFIGEQIVYLDSSRSVTNARTRQAAQPRLLGMDARPETQNSKPETLHTLAQWLTHPTNTLFAQAQVNRVWFHLMGRGLVEPIDDFRPTNPASHPALLAALAEDFVAQGFDLRHLIRVIMNSRTYQLSAEPNDTNADDEVNYSHAVPRRLSAEQLLDAQHQVLDLPARFRGYPSGVRATQVAKATPVRRGELKARSLENFLSVFGKPARLLACECERTAETTMSQAFQLISGPAINELIAHPDNRLIRLLASGRSTPQLIEELYWIALSRPPTSPERYQASAHIEASESARQGLEDLTWALLNAKEFVLRK